MANLVQRLIVEDAGKAAPVLEGSVALEWPDGTPIKQAEAVQPAGTVADLVSALQAAGLMKSGAAAAAALSADGDPRPTSKWTNEDTAAWMAANGIEASEGMTKAQMLEAIEASGK